MVEAIKKASVKKGNMEQTSLENPDIKEILYLRTSFFAAHLARLVSKREDRHFFEKYTIN